MSSSAVDAGLLLIRVCCGLTMAAHGHGKFFKGGKIAGTAGWFDSMGMRPGKVHAVLAASTEVGAGLALACGLLTPLAAAGFVSLMIVAGYTVHRSNGFFIVKQGWEYNMVLAVIPVGIALIGPGRWSIDHLLELDSKISGWTSGAIAAGVGILGGVGTLLGFYRPPAAT
ncbi:MAG TPA: DoxX family protein [Acidimicrobiaceae bacterium]|nr:DoxX family protein [Acidimicrobiaceae bacterium]